MEQVDLTTSDRRVHSPSYRSVTTTLAQEFAETEQRRVFLLTRGQEKAFLAELAGLGATSRKAGAFGRFLIYLEPVPALPPLVP